MRRIHNQTLLLIAILLVAALVRLAGIGWSLPNTYEEATPLRVAVTMWGWQTDGVTSLNPAFFNYPSLTFYIHFLAQGILFLILKVAGTIASATDWYVAYVTDPTPQYLASRLVSAIFGILTVLVTFHAGKILAGARAGLLAALFVATNPFHVARSQMIETDIPLTFFVTLAAYAMTRIVQHGRTRDYMLAGIAIGLAVSSKYTGAFLLVPLVVSHFMAPQRSRWGLLIGAIAIVAGVFTITSPYVFLDWAKFRADTTLERDHMRRGHFGTVDIPTWKFYAQSLVTRLAGVPALVLAVAGVVFLRASKIAWAMLALTVTYLVVLMPWSMKADAYLMPLVPVLLVFTAAGAVALSERASRFLKGRHAPVAVLGVITCIVVATHLAGIANRREAAQHDVRTDAQEWIESHLPAGVFIVGESYGPDLLSPAFVLQLKPEVRAKAMQRWKDRPLFAFTALPMYQSRPEQSAPFYDLDLYAEADYIMTTGPVRSRYAREPEKFAAQMAFYEQLEQRCRKVQEFGDAEATRLVLYQTTARAQSFAQRDSVAPPPAISRDFANSTGRESGFYFSLGTNYEYFRHMEEAAESYRLALRYGTGNRQVFYNSAFGYARCLGALGRIDEAHANLSRLHAQLDDPQLSAGIARLLASMKSGP